MKIDWIDPQILAAGSIPFGAKDIRSLASQGIRAIVSLTSHSLTIAKAITPQFFTDLDITYLHSPIRDHYAPQMAQAKEILAFIARMHQESRPTFIHCHAGVGRTGTMLHTYFLNKGLSLEEAKERVKSKRVACTLLSEVQWGFLAEFSEQMEPRLPVRSAR